jgi:hypothetical protein
VQLIINFFLAEINDPSATESRPALLLHSSFYSLSSAAHGPVRFTAEPPETGLGPRHTNFLFPAKWIHTPKKRRAKLISNFATTVHLIFSLA